MLRLFHFISPRVGTACRGGETARTRLLHERDQSESITTLLIISGSLLEIAARKLIQTRSSSADSVEIQVSTGRYDEFHVL